MNTPTPNKLQQWINASQFGEIEIMELLEERGIIMGYTFAYEVSPWGCDNAVAYLNQFPPTLSDTNVGNTKQ